MVEFWIVVSQKRPLVHRAGTPVRKSSLIGVDVVKRCGTEESALDEALLCSRKNPDCIYIVMHTIAAFGVKEPEPVQLNIEKVVAPKPESARAMPFFNPEVENDEEVEEVEEDWNEDDDDDDI